MAVKVYEYRDRQHAYWEVFDGVSVDPIFTTDNILAIARFLVDNELDFELIGKMVNGND